MKDNFVFRNRTIDKGQLKKLIAWAFTHHGTARTARVADKLKDLGFRYATKAGISISVDDLQVPESKRRLLKAAEEEIKATEARYSKGEITEVERFQKVIDTWNSTSEALKDEVVRNFKESDPLNSVYMMAFSGARGNISQVRQLVGMRGLMADPQGEIIDQPIKTNFREGLTVTEYIISSYGARKGLVDTALRTADSGYLTRRLVDVSQDVIIREVDCGTNRGIPVRSMTDGDRILIPLRDRLLGRVTKENVVHPKTGEVLVSRNSAISEELAQVIHSAGVEEVFVRSPLTCEAVRSACQYCYGWSLAHASMVDLGEAVGIIAAQSIGEPGTQLTMRTFHTGGVFTGEMARQVRANFSGTLHYSPAMRTRAFRTRHGEEAMVVETEAKLRIVETRKAVETREIPASLPEETTKERAKEREEQISIPQGSIVYVTDGAKVEAGQILAEVPLTGRNVRRSTEKATKDVATDLAGEVKFADLAQEEKTDRQGNKTRTAVRGGLIWVLSGEVYNLPPGAEPVVKNGTYVEANSVLAQTKLISEGGGIVRLTHNTDANGKGGREIEIITASVLLKQGRVRVESYQGRDHYLIESGNQVFSLKATPGTKVAQGQVVAELLDERYRTATGGIVKYAGVEVAKRGKAKQGYEVVSGGSLLWIPEEAHEVNKDISLLLVEDGQYVEAGSEVVKDIFCQNSGVVEVVQKNDILREIVIKPGQLHLVDDPEEVMGKDGTLVYPGNEAMAGIAVDELRYVEYVETPEGPALLLRPVTEYAIPDTPSIPSQTGTGSLSSWPLDVENSGSEPDGEGDATLSKEGGQYLTLRAVQRLPYKDGERVKSVEGLELLRTQLVLEIGKDATCLNADIELVPDEEDPSLLRLQLVILESLSLKRDVVADATQGSTNTRLLVRDGQKIEKGAVVARTEILCKEAGEVRGIKGYEEVVRRILVVRGNDLVTVKCANGGEINTNLSVKVGDLVVAGEEIAPGVRVSESGQVVRVMTDGHQEVQLRVARPYRVSPGAVLHIDDGDLVQRGDNLVLLVFERTKTGDIIQGLPRIEELLEARKPREACILAVRPGTVQLAWRADELDEIKVIEETGQVAQYPLGAGSNALVSDGQEVLAGEPLTDGPANPHEIMEIFFELNREMGPLEAALQAMRATQAFLVNEVQSVYQSQGIDISDKHIEVIVRQMTSKVRIDDGGDTTMLPGELVELRQVEQVNEAMSITGGAPAQYTPVLLGITKASLNTDSFISAASFQETTRVLTEAAIEGKSDWLRGLKENVIIGRLIPAGTGYNAYEDSVGGERSDVDLSYERDAILDDEEDQLRLGSYDKDAILDDRTARQFGSLSPFNRLETRVNRVSTEFDYDPGDLEGRSLLDEDELIYDEADEDDDDDDDDEGDEEE